MFDDAHRGDLRWTRGSIGLLAAGLSHGAVILLQVLLLGGFVLYSLSRTGTADPVLLGVWILCMALPAVLTGGAALLLLAAARVQRDHGPAPLVHVALVCGVFLPALRMSVAMLSCNVFEVPLHLLPALATLLAAVLVASDRPVQPPS